MMAIMTKIVVMVLIVSATWFALAQTNAVRPATPFTQRLPALDGKELRLTQVEVRYAPGQASQPHSHPCPVVVRVIEGSVITKVDKNPETTYKEGDTFYEPPNGIHAVSRNASDSAPARILATFVCDSDVPLTKAPPGEY